MGIEGRYVLFCVGIRFIVAFTLTGGFRVYPSNFGGRGREWKKARGILDFRRLASRWVFSFDREFIQIVIYIRF